MKSIRKVKYTGGLILFGHYWVVGEYKIGEYKNCSFLEDYWKDTYFWPHLEPKAKRNADAFYKGLAG